MLIIWRHLKIQVPDDWEMLLFGRDPAAGRCTFADRTQHRLELNWREVPGRPDFERMLADYRSELDQDEQSEDVETVTHADWPGLAARTRGVLTSRFGRYFEGEGCLVEVVFIWPERRDDRLERGVLRSIGEEPADEQGYRRWRAFGMEMRPTDGLPLKEIVAQPGSARMVFGDANDKLREERFERFGMVEEWLKEPVGVWLKRRVPLEVTVRSASTNGAMDVLEGDRPALGAKRLVGRRLPYHAEAWIEPADGRLYCFTTTGAPAGTGRRLAYWGEEGTP